MSDASDFLAQNSKVFDEHGEAFAKALERVALLEQSGQFERVIQVLSFLTAALDAMTPEIIAGLVKTISNIGLLGDQVMQIGLLEKMPDALTQVSDVLDHPPTVTGGPIRRVMSALKDPETRVGLEVALELLKRLGKSVSEN